MQKIILILFGLFIQLAHFGQSAISVEKQGTGKPILFLPGFATPGSVWQETVYQLKEGYEAHIVTYAGFGSVAPIAMPWYSQLKEALVAYIRDNKMTDVYIIGHSMGGNLAVDIAAATPAICKKIILVDAIPCMRALMMPGVAAADLHYDSPYNQQLLSMDEAALDNYTKMMAANMTDDSTKVPLLMQWMKTADRKTFVYGYTDLLRLDLRPVLPQLKVPVLILGAPFPDKKIVLGNYTQQYSNLQQKEIVLAPGGRHFIMFDEPQWFYEKVNNFLD